MEMGQARSALKTAISTIGDEFAVDDLRDNPNVPGAIVYPDAPFDWAETFEGGQRLRLCVLILVAYIDTQDAQTQLDAYLARTGAKSVPAAIATNPIFQITEFKSYGVMSLSEGGTRYLTAELVVEVWI